MEQNLEAILQNQELDNKSHEFRLRLSTTVLVTLK